MFLLHLRDKFGIIIL